MLILLHFPALCKAWQFHLIWDLRNCTYPFALRMVPMKSLKSFHDFHHWKFQHASVYLKLFAISTYKQKLHFNNCKVDCEMSLMFFHVKLSFLEVHFSVLTLFEVVHVTSNPPKHIYANFWNIVDKDNILKIENVHFPWYNITTPRKFCTQNWCAY